MALTSATLWQLLGYPNGFEHGRLRQVSALPSVPGVAVAELDIVGPRGRFPAFLLTPEGGARGASVLYAHAHGNRYDIGKAEVLEGRPALLAPPLGLALAHAGHVVLCPDMPGFGARQAEGTEAALTKAALWQGRTLLGDMLADLRAALDVLAEWPAAQGYPIATVGISMGGTLAYWLAALDGRVAGVAQLCVLAQMRGLIAAQAHDLHGIYMTVPGLLTEGDMGDVAALVAPRPQVVGAGLADPLTPWDALEPALDTLRAAYRDCPEGLAEVIDPKGEHKETAAMRAAVLSMLAKLS